MTKKTTILMAAAECRGIAKVGGLADVVYDLSSELIAVGHRVHVLLPRYADLPPPPETHPKQVLDFLVLFEGTAVPTRLYQVTIGKLEVHLIEAPFFQAEGGSVYVDSGKRGKGPFEDDARRFAFFSAAVWELVKHHSPFSQTELIHCHDWHTALIPLLAQLDKAKGVSTLFTIHNLDYQGTRPFDEPYAVGASWRQWFPERWEALVHSGWMEAIADPQAPHCFNPMRCGIRVSDGVNTVSPTYAREITQKDDPAANFLGGRGLESDLALRKNQGRLWGILNGLDYQSFDPATLEPPYEAGLPDLMVRKRAHRDQLWARFPQIVDILARKHGPRFANIDQVRAHLPEFLDASRGLPLTVCVTRAVSQKLGLFTEKLSPRVSVSKAFLAQGTSLVLLGTGELEDRLQGLNNEPTALFLQVFDADLAVQLYAAGELFLMPSDFEPCGISQLMSLRYGCLPLVHDRGGLHDTVHHGRTGFVYQGSTRQKAKQAFLKVADQAISTVRGESYEAMVREAMNQRFEWGQAVTEYQNIYQLVSTKG